MNYSTTIEIYIIYGVLFKWYYNGHYIQDRITSTEFDTTTTKLGKSLYLIVTKNY